MNLKDLTKEIPYKWRTGPGGKQLAYIDSRDVQDLLDEVVGAENWQSDFKLIDNKLFGGIGVYCNVAKTGEYYQWIWKWDCGTESNIDEEKGQVSDALKRAGVQWGIGRFLYDIKDGKPKEQPKKPTSEHRCTKHNEDMVYNQAKDSWYCVSCYKEYKAKNTK